MGGSASTIAPGATIGILGGGQLGRMIAQAAARLGYRCHIYCPETDSPAAQVASRHTIGGLEDETRLREFAAAVDVVTYEFENIPAGPVEILAEIVPVRPNARALRVAQDRMEEKRFAATLGIATAPWLPVRSEAEAQAAIATIGRPAMLKTARLGYDGKGQVKIGAGEDATAAWRGLGGAPCVLEGFVDFAMEISVIVARGLDGAMLAYPAVENRHKNGILDVTIAPADLAPAIAAAARDAALRLTQALDIVGLLAVEMFVARDGGVLVNEMAPRPHNSGHWTLDACATSQFEQLVRAICGLKLGGVDVLCPAIMQNLIGAEVEHWRAAIEDPRAKLHLYGKTAARPGRKMGHVTRLLRP
ncbi:MAG: 5-(carboxyamino)imidazole ribonucleotide synthase [Rhodospirillaceae bacterium]|nr:5-(carboxyamino)imidazole ribonucleotide synthase [Rhodospirillaceae bacterium]